MRYCGYQLVYGMCLLVVVACGRQTRVKNASAPLSFAQDIRPLLETKCVTCHQSANLGGHAPFAFASVQDIAARRDAVRAAIAENRMPPWSPDSSCTDYKNGTGLSSKEKKALLSWLDADDSFASVQSNEAATLSVNPERKSLGLGRTDKTLKPAAAYSPAVAPDEYRCFVLDWGESQLRYITGFRALPGTPAIVHHVIGFLAAPKDVAHFEKLDEADAKQGYSCFGGSGGTANWVGSWAPGQEGGDFPADTGIKVEPGSKIILQVHYNLAAETSPGVLSDLTSLEFKVDSQVAKEGFVMPWTNPLWTGHKQMPIPAGVADVKHAFEFDPTAFMSRIAKMFKDNMPFTLYSAFLHMHTLGSKGRLEIVREEGAKECLLDIPRWNFHNQAIYEFAVPKKFRPGDALGIECHWNNSGAHSLRASAGLSEHSEHGLLVNHATLKVPKDVYWGEGTGDEMCLGGFYITQD